MKRLSNSMLGVQINASDIITIKCENLTMNLYSEHSKDTGVRKSFDNMHVSVQSTLSIQYVHSMYTH